MSRFKTLALLFSSILMTSLSAVAASEHSGVAQTAEALFRIPGIGLPVTNSMVTSWIVAIILIVVIRLAVRKPQLIPSRSQAVVESLVEGVLDLTAPIVGSQVARKTFPLLVGLFTYILIQNWSGLFPGVGTLMIRENGEWKELIRPGNADMNGTGALAAVAMVCWFYFVMRYAGPKLVLFDIFGNKAERKDIPVVIYYCLFPVFFFVGLIELVSILFRLVSLSFRLFGNVFGGENLLHAMSGLFKWGLPVPFYFLEIIIGLVQALVFTLLVSVYIGLICNHGDDHHDEPQEGASGHH